MNSRSSPNSGRIVGVDAARGMAMFFSCLAHFAWWVDPAWPKYAGVLSDIGKIATPTFLILSGTMTAWLCTTARNPKSTRYKLLNRSLFLLTFGHLLISFTESHRNGGFLGTVAGATIIDDIGLCMLCCVPAIFLLRQPTVRRILFWAGLMGLLLCWLAVLNWHPTTQIATLLRQALLGPALQGGSLHGYTSPTLQYGCLFAVGIGASDFVIAAASAPMPEAAYAMRRLMTVGVTLIIGAIALRSVRWMLDQQVSSSFVKTIVDATLTITGKMPPAPAYLAYFGGAGLVLSVLLFAATRSPFAPLQRLVAELAHIGRASLFVFVFQYFVFWTVPDVVGVHPGASAPIVFVAGLAIIWLAARGWNALHGNRLLTLGIAPARAAG